jgi:hypothetical protein
MTHRLVPRNRQGRPNLRRPGSTVCARRFWNPTWITTHESTWWRSVPDFRKAHCGSSPSTVPKARRVAGLRHSLESPQPEGREGVHPHCRSTCPRSSDRQGTRSRAKRGIQVQRTAESDRPYVTNKDVRYAAWQPPGPLRTSPYGLRLREGVGMAGCRTRQTVRRRRMKTYTDRKGRVHAVFPVCCTSAFCARHSLPAGPAGIVRSWTSSTNGSRITKPLRG